MEPKTTRMLLFGGIVLVAVGMMTGQLNGVINWAQSSVGMSAVEGKACTAGGNVYNSGEMIGGKKCVNGVWMNVAGGVTPTTAPTTPATLPTADNGIIVAPGSATPVTLTCFDKQDPSTQVGATYLVSINGGAFQTHTNGGTIAQGSRVRFLVTNNTAYHNTIWPGPGITDTYTIPLTSTAEFLQPKLDKNASVSITGYDVINHASLTDGGGANNYTIGAGQTGQIDLTYTGESFESTNPMQCVIELNNKTSMDITLTTFGGQLLTIGTPAYYTMAGTNSAVGTVEMAALTSSESVTKRLTVPSLNALDMSGQYVKVTCYSYEYKQETANGADKGDVVFKVANNAGTVNSIQKNVFTAYFQ